VTRHYPAISIAEFYDQYKAFDLLVDSRRLTDPDRTLFFALPGERTDGHAFIEELYGRGVRHFVVEKEGARTQVHSEVLRSKDINLVVTENPLGFLQDIAAFHRQQFNIPVLGITGSNGKTIVKDWLVTLLGNRFAVCSSPRSFNSQIGVPLSVWQLKPHHEIAIFEAGVSRSGEMRKLAKIIQPTCGAFTVLGQAHAAGFRSEEEKLKEKIGLFAGADWVVVPADDNDSIGLLRKLDVDPVRQLGFGRRLVEVNEIPLRLDFPDLPSIYLDNAYTAVAAGHMLGLELEEIAAALPALQPLGNRLEQREGLHGGPVINDSYSNDLSALAAALDFAVAQNPDDHLTLILGSLQPGSFNLPSTRVHAQNETAEDPVSQLLGPRVTRLITVGRTNKRLGAQLHYDSPEALLADLINLSFGKETILVKGASSERLGRVADALSRKQHRTVLKIDLAALRHNFNVYRKSVDAGIIVMVKASAYGGGALPVARAVGDVGADYLAVAYPDEGTDLRRGGVTLPVMVLNAEPYAFGRMRDDALEPVVHSVTDLRAAVSSGLRVHLELDTGMGRLGFRPEALEELLEELTKPKYHRAIASVFTHLAASEAEIHDAFTREQLEDFDSACGRIDEVLPTSPARHALNTNGITRFPDKAYDFVRLGIGLYGIGDATRAAMLRTVLQLTTRVTAVYDRPAGTTIGYGRRGKLERKGRVAVLAIGYADGLPRLAGEGRFAVMINGHLAPTIGSVCMDMTMIDVTDLPEVMAGDEAVVFGPELPIDVLAKAAQTIPYEVLTGIGERVHRVYSQE
jgi:alanine racemase